MIRIINGLTQIDQLEKILTRTQLESKEVLQRVDEILEDVRLRGDAAVLEYSRRYDGHELTSLKVTEAEIAEARPILDPALKAAIVNAIANITRFHEQQIDPGSPWRNGRGSC